MAARNLCYCTVPRLGYGWNPDCERCGRPLTYYAPREPGQMALPFAQDTTLPRSAWAEQRGAGGSLSPEGPKRRVGGRQPLTD